MFKVFIDVPDGQTIGMFKDKGWEIVDSVEQSDLVCFIGGADVSPVLYHEKNTGSHCEPDHDLLSLRVYMDAVKFGKSCVGICRGGQFLNVMNGGKMIQHINGHCLVGTHTITLQTRDTWCTAEEIKTFNNLTFKGTSVHHQGIVPNEESDVILSGESPDGNTEVVLYCREFLGSLDTPDECFDFCFQPHPEYHNAEKCMKPFFDIIEEFLL
jgi:gamma-glutamyl-gamma-aminobutyrate hydrolase PuuD